MADVIQKKFLDQSGVTTLWSRITKKLGDDSASLKALIDANTAAIGAEETRAKAAEKANADSILALQAIVNSILGNEDEIDLNSIAELAAWINEHGNEAAAMAEAIEALTAKLLLGVDAEGEEYATVKAYVEASVVAAKAYADSLAGNYDAAGSAAQALVDAKAYADGLAGNYDAAGAAAQALIDAKAYADGLAGNYDAAGAAEQALKDAKAYADSAANTIYETATAYTDALANGQVTTNKNDIANIIANMPVALSTEEIDAAIAAANANA